MGNFSELHNTCLKVFESVAGTTTIFILPLFLGRVVFSNIMGDGSKAFTALKGALMYFVLIAAFPLIVEILFSIPEAYLPKFDSMSIFANGTQGWELSSIPFSLDRIIEVILAGLYWVVYYLHVFFMLLMCSMAPIVFLLSALLGVGLGLEIFMGLLIVGSSWPIIWYGFDQVHSSLVTAQTDAFGAKCLELLVTLFKGLAPVSFASLAVKSPAGRAITQAASGAVAVAKWSGLTAIRGAASVVPTKSFSSASKSGHVERSRSNYHRNSVEKSRTHFNTDSLKKARYQSQFSSPKKGFKKNENSQSRNIQT